MTDNAVLTFDPPPMSVSMPEVLDWHMILDHELSQLTKPEAGVLGSLGFVGLGAILGLIPQLVSTFEKLKMTPVPPITGSDIAAVAAFFGSMVLTIVCLVIWSLYRLRNRGLADKIRKRGKRGFAWSSSSAESAVPSA